MQVEPSSPPYHRPWHTERPFVEWAEVTAPRRITRPELENLRRSIGASGGLAPDQLERLIADTERLLVERQHMAHLIEGLRGLWPELRRVLNDLHSVLRADGPGDRA